MNPMRWLPVVLSLLGGTIAAPASPLLLVESERLPSPANPSAFAPHLASAPARGLVAQVWMEKDEGAGARVRVATVSTSSVRWTEPVTVAAGADLVANPYSTPQIVVTATGDLVALWYVTNPGQADHHHPTYHALVSRSSDGGKTWSRPSRLTTESVNNEFAALAPLPDGSVLAVWLDGRNKKVSEGSGAHGDATGDQALYGNTLYSSTGDTLIDDRVCDCCPTGLAAFEDGSALAVYRDRSAEEVRDVVSVRYRKGKWQSPAPLGAEGWKIGGCPVNGPALASRGPHVSAVWYSGAGGAARIHASISAAAGEPFLAPLRIDDHQALGHVGAAVLQDGTAFCTWVEQSAANDTSEIWLRRIAPDGTRSVPSRLAAFTSHRKRGIPRLAVSRDEPGRPAELILAYTESQGEVTVLASQRLTIAPAEADAAPCAHCPPVETRGHAVHGFVRNLLPEKGQVVVKHDDIPGVMPAMTMRFRIAPEESAGLAPGTEVFGRVEKRDDGWWIFDLRRVSR